MSKHTPGPWRPSYDRGYFVETDHDDKPSSGNVCNIEQGDGCSKEEAQANARLIAAAPDLLKACKAMVTYCGKYAIEDYAKGQWPYQNLMDAIAKAEGK